MKTKTSYCILVVDDDAFIRRALAQFLCGRGFDVATAASASDALEVLDQREVDLVFTDVLMPEASGLDLLRSVRQRRAPIDVVIITGYLEISDAIGAIRRGAYDFLTKPLNYERVALTVERVREHRRLLKDAERCHVLSRERQLALETTLSLARASEERDRQNNGHGKRTAQWAVRIGRKLHYTEERLEQLRYGALLHDVGKVGIDDAILNKPAALTASERSQIERHSVIGEYIVTPISAFSDVIKTVRHHHEHYDGTGYPDGLAEDEIPLDARIVCVADYFDAITSDRPYRRPAGVDEALAIIESERGKTLDPMLTDLFIDIVLESRASSVEA